MGYWVILVLNYFSFGRNMRQGKLPHLINSYRFPVEFDHVHDFYGIIRILFSKKLYKSISLMGLGDPVFRHVYIH